MGVPIPQLSTGDCGECLGESEDDLREVGDFGGLVWIGEGEDDVAEGLEGHGGWLSRILYCEG
jgi:hypothetical protein